MEEALVALVICVVSFSLGAYYSKLHFWASLQYLANMADQLGEENLELKKEVLGLRRKIKDMVDEGEGWKYA